MSESHVVIVDPPFAYLPRTFRGWACSAAKGSEHLQRLSGNSDWHEVSERPFGATFRLGDVRSGSEIPFELTVIVRGTSAAD